MGPYASQAAIAACHARARSADETDWPRIAGLYDELGRLMPSLVVELNRRSRWRWRSGRPPAERERTLLLERAAGCD
jgi:predicted RNA polymerase sigma factor